MLSVIKTRTGKKCSFFAFFFLLVSCSSRSDDLSRAQQELDKREYAKVISRLEPMAKDDPNILNNEKYVDL